MYCPRLLQRSYVLWQIAVAFVLEIRPSLSVFLSLCQLIKPGDEANTFSLLYDNNIKKTTMVIIMVVLTVVVVGLF